MSEMTVDQRKEHGKKQKEYLTNLILEYQRGPVKHTPESLRNKTLRQLENICSREGI